MIDCVMISVPPLALTGPHIGPALLKSYAQQKGYTVTCFNPSLNLADVMDKEDFKKWPYNDFDQEYKEKYNTDELINSWIDEWLATDPRLIGLSTHVWASKWWLGEICQRLRQRTDIKIIMGGPAAIELGDYALEQNWIDYHVVGDGEEAFLNALENKFDHPSMNSNKPHAVSNETFAELPEPDFSDISFEKYKELYPTQNRIFLIGTRGCVFDCSFCNVPALMKYRFKDGAKFAEEVKRVQQEYKPEFIEFADSLINGSLREYRKLISRLAELNKEDPDNIPKIVAFYRIRPLHQTLEEDFKNMAESGFFRLKIGVESGSKEVRDHIGKTETDDEIMYTFEMCRKYGLRINLLIIVGYPTETQADFEKTMDMLRMIQDNGFSDVVDRAVVNELYISTDTGLSKQIEELEIKDAETNTKWTRTLPNGEILDPKERKRRLVRAISFIRENFGGKLMVFSDSDTSIEDNKK
jgi:hypothetical protein